MEKREASGTTAAIALLRAIEAQKPRSQRKCYDSCALALIPGGVSSFLSGLVINSGIYERMAPGATAFVVGRERNVDDILKAAWNDGLDQVVILGAGFDTHACRIPGIEKSRVFEVDHPATRGSS
jgi:methyltransferase (TIGR00027 family)